MFQTLEIMISLGVIFLILSMINKYLISFVKRFISTKAKVITNEMETFIGEKTSKHLKSYLKNKGKHLNFLDDKERLRQLSKEQLKAIVGDLDKFMKNENVTEFKKILGIDITDKEIKEEINKIKAHLNNLKDEIENMYDNTMEKISEIYNKNLRYLTLIVGILLAFVINADLFGIYIILSNNPIMRKEIVTQSEKINKEMEELFEKIRNDAGEGVESIQKEIDKAKTEVTDLIGKVESAGIVLGWTKAKFWSAFSSPGSFFYKLIGLLLAGFLISFGAPFWHDFIGTFTGLRKILKGTKGGNAGTKSSFRPNPLLP